MTENAIAKEIVDAAFRRRPSCLDLITLLRKEVAQQPELAARFGLETSDSSLVQAAAA